MEVQFLFGQPIHTKQHEYIFKMYFQEIVPTITTIIPNYFKIGYRIAVVHQLSRGWAQNVGDDDNGCCCSVYRSGNQK